MCNEEEPFPLGIIYQSARRATFEENLAIYKKDKSPLYKRDVDMKKVAAAIQARI